MTRRHCFLTSAVLTPSSFFSLIFSQWRIFHLVQLYCPSHTWPLSLLPSAFKWMMYPKGKIHIEFFSNYPLLLSTIISILDFFIFRKLTPHRALILLSFLFFSSLTVCWKNFKETFFFFPYDISEASNQLFQCLSTISAHSVDLQSGKGKPANDKMCTIWCDLSMCSVQKPQLCLCTGREKLALSTDGIFYFPFKLNHFNTWYLKIVHL